MAGRNGTGSPKHEALVALAQAVGDHYRATGDEGFTIVTSRQGDLIEVTAYYSPATRLKVFIPVTDAGWNVYVETQLTHEFNTCCSERIKYEKFGEMFIAGKVKAVADAYR